MHAKGLTATVVVTLALGIGANAAIFSVVRGVLLRPLVNRDEDRLIYIRQTAPGIGFENMTFSVPEIDDLKSRVRTISAFGDFSTVDFTMIGLGGEPRIVKAGVVSGSFFEVMGLRPVIGRLLNTGDDGPKAAGTAVLTYRFWTTTLSSDPSVIGKTIRLGPRTATVVGVLEPSVPYPADTEIIANVVTSPHHLGATMVTGRTHRMTELFGRLAPGATLEAARAELTTVHEAIKREHPEAYSTKANVQLTVSKLRDQIAAPARTILLLLLGAAAVVFVIACSNVANLILARSVRRESELAVRAALGAGKRRAAADTAGGERRALRRRRRARRAAGATPRRRGRPLCRALFGPRARSERRHEPALGRRRAGDGGGGAARLRSAAAVAACADRVRAGDERGPHHAGDESAPSRVRHHADSVFVRAARRRRHAASPTLIALQSATTGYNTRQVLALDMPPAATGRRRRGGPRLLRRGDSSNQRTPGVDGVAVGNFVPWRDAGILAPGSNSAPKATRRRTAKRTRSRGCAWSRPRFFAVLGVPVLAGREFNDGDRADSELVVDRQPEPGAACCSRTATR